MDTLSFIKKLPDDIIRYIIPFTYQVQNKELLINICKPNILTYKNTQDIMHHPRRWEILRLMAHMGRMFS
jgi:hypothetical protein